jgi:multicomponent Na+:H+ antiporter subunit E
MLRAVVLFVILLLLWLLLSGIFQPLLLGLGVASCALVVWIALRKDLLDAEGLPMHLNLLRTLRYAIWLGWQILLTTLDVTRRIWHPALPISAGVRHVPAELGDVARVIYANSITLTPGTLSIDVEEDRILVHSLTEEGLADLEAGEMYRRVKALED